jgi:hypothetical protein
MLPALEKVVYVRIRFIVKVVQKKVRSVVFDARNG